MREYIKKKLKRLIKIIFLSDSSAAIIYAMYKTAIDEEISAIALLIIFSGFFLAWLSSLCVYGFGKQVENKENKSIESNVSEQENMFLKAGIVKCPSCGRIQKKGNKKCLKCDYIL